MSVQLVKSHEGIWLVMNNYPRPATSEEIALWEELDSVRKDYDSLVVVATRACEAEFTNERLKAMQNLRDQLDGRP